MVWAWTGPNRMDGTDGDRRRWKSDKQRSTDFPEPPPGLFDTGAARRSRERSTLRRIRSLAESLAVVTNAYNDMNADSLGARHIAAHSALGAMQTLCGALDAAVAELYCDD